MGVQDLTETWDEVLVLVVGLVIGKSTQRHTGSTGVRVDPKREPGEDDDEQGGSVYTHQVEAHLPPQSKNHLHTRVVTYHTKVQKGALNRHVFFLESHLMATSSTRPERAYVHISAIHGKWKAFTCPCVELGAVAIFNVLLFNIKLRQSYLIHLYRVSRLPHKLQVICGVAN